MMLLPLLLAVAPVVTPVTSLTRPDGGTALSARIEGSVFTLPQPAAMGAFGSQLVSEERIEVSLAFSYNINTELVNFVSDGGISRYVRPFVELSGDAGSIYLESNATLCYLPGQGVNVRLTVCYSPCASMHNQEVGAGTEQDGLFFGCCRSCGLDGGASFGALRRNNGADEWTPQASWNVNPRPDLDPTKGSPYAIDYQWGFGQIRFHVENPASGLFEPVHIVRYANTSATTSLTNPSLPLRAAVTHGAVLRVPSMSLIRQGRNNTAGVRRSLTATRNSATGSVSLVAGRNEAQYAGARNFVRISPDFISCTNAGSSGQDVTVEIREHAVATGGAWVAVDTSTSVSSINAASTASTGGRSVFSIQLDGASNVTVDLRPYIIRIHPGDTFVIKTTSRAGMPSVACSFSWVEEF